MVPNRRRAVDRALAAPILDHPHLGLTSSHRGMLHGSPRSTAVGQQDLQTLAPDLPAEVLRRSLFAEPPVPLNLGRQACDRPGGVPKDVLRVAATAQRLQKSLDMSAPPLQQRVPVFIKLRPPVVIRRLVGVIRGRQAPQLPQPLDRMHGGPPQQKRLIWRGRRSRGEHKDGAPMHKCTIQGDFTRDNGGEEQENRRRCRQPHWGFQSSLYLCHGWENGARAPSSRPPPRDISVATTINLSLCRDPTRKRARRRRKNARHHRSGLAAATLRLGRGV